VHFLFTAVRSHVVATLAVTVTRPCQLIQKIFVSSLSTNRIDPAFRVLWPWEAIQASPTRPVAFPSAHWIPMVHKFSVLCHLFFDEHCGCISSSEDVSSGAARSEAAQFSLSPGIWRRFLLDDDVNIGQCLQRPPSPLTPHCLPFLSFALPPSLLSLLPSSHPSCMQWSLPPHLLPLSRLICKILTRFLIALGILIDVRSTYIFEAPRGPHCQSVFLFSFSSISIHIEPFQTSSTLPSAGPRSKQWIIASPD
jgi:hypothetical protein